MVTLLRLAACSVPASQFSMVAPHRSQAHSRRSLLHWAHRRLLQPLAAPPLSPSLGLLRAASPTGRALRAPRHCHPQFAMVRSAALTSSLAALPPLSSAWSLRIVRKLTRGAPCFTGLIDGYCSHWLRRLFRPHWAYYGLFPPQAAAFVRPLQFPLKSYGFPGAETARKRFLLWKMEFSSAAYCEPMHPLNSAWSYHCARRLACGTPCFIGLTSRCFAHRARASCAPAVHAAGTIVPRKGFGPLALSLDFFDKLSHLKGGLNFLSAHQGLAVFFALPAGDELLRRAAHRGNGEAPWPQCRR